MVLPLVTSCAPCIAGVAKVAAAGVAATGIAVGTAVRTKRSRRSRRKHKGGRRNTRKRTGNVLKELRQKRNENLSPNMLECLGSPWTGKAPKNKKTKKKLSCPYLKDRKKPFTFKHGNQEARDRNHHYQMCYDAMYKDCQKKTKEKRGKDWDNTYLEYNEGKSHKFWEITRDKTRITTRWGRLDAKGQELTKDYGSKSKEQYLKMVKEKKKKGYISHWKKSTKQTEKKKKSKKTRRKRTRW